MLIFSQCFSFLEKKIVEPHCVTYVNKSVGHKKMLNGQWNDILSS